MFWQCLPRVDLPNQDYHIDIFLDISRLAEFDVELPKSVILKNHEKFGVKTGVIKIMQLAEE